jgi:hypothetical protein
VIGWLGRDQGLSAEEAYVLVSIAGDVRISQIVDPAVTARVAVPKWPGQYSAAYILLHAGMGGNRQVTDVA